ncbi:hypothetical protein FOA52_007783 [Chlamydomonas sp. UWO 241]|nr:hypothetical protein FOA52_007783 [Chlamydomonas sp. UWO 241]
MASAVGSAMLHASSPTQQQQQHPGMLDAKSLLLRKEQEVASLRESALAQLEAQLQAKQGEHELISKQFEQLKSDFRYNLSLLEDRDTELERYDSQAAVQAQAAAEREKQLEETQRALAEASSELRLERARYSEAEFLAQAKRTELQRHLEDERVTHAEAMLRQREEAEQQRRALQRVLTETQEELSHQRRDMAGASAMQAAHLEAKYKMQADAAHQARFAADRGQMITIVSAYSPTEAASDEEAGDFYLRVAALADKANDKRDLLIVAGGSQRRAWDSSQLRRPAVRREFNLQLSDRFGLLEAVPPEGADAQAEYDAMTAAIHEVATNHLAPRGSRRRRGWQFTLSQRTLRLMEARQRAHSAWLRSKSAAAKRERNRANRAADAAVQRGRERWIGQQVAEAQDMLRKKNLRQFARACDRLAGRSRSHQIPPAMRDVSGALHSGPDGVLKAMTESFDKLYGGETKLNDETLNQLENDVAAFELTHATEVDEAHGRPPDLAETEACEADTLRQLAAAREAEANAAAAREAAAHVAAAAAGAAEREAVAAARAALWELDALKRLKEEQVSELTEQLDSSRSVSKASASDADAQVAGLSAQLAAVSAQLEEVGSSAAVALARIQATAREDGALLRVRLEQAQGSVFDLARRHA